MYKAKELNLHTDSQFTINCITKWMQGWKRKDWKLSNGEDVKNITDLKCLDYFNSQIRVNWVNNNTNNFEII